MSLSKTEVTLELAHARLGDIGIDTLKLMRKNAAAEGLKFKDTDEKFECKVCSEANLKRARVPRKRTRNLDIMDLLGCDLQQVETPGHSGKIYFAIYAEHKCGCVLTHPLQRKSDQARIGKQVIERLETLSAKRLRTFRADQGGEYMSNEFIEYLHDKGIHVETSDTKEAFQNGLAEVMGGKIITMMRAARVRSGVPKCCDAVRFTYVYFVLYHTLSVLASHYILRDLNPDPSVPD